MYKVILVILACLVALSAAKSGPNIQAFSATLYSSASSVAEFNIYLDLDDGDLFVSGVHGCDSGLACEVDTIAFWTGDWSIHYADLAVTPEAIRQNTLNFQLAITDFASPVATKFSATGDSDLSTRLSALLTAPAYVKIGLADQAATSGFLGPITPIYNWALPSESKFIGNHLYSSPRGRNIVSENFAMTLDTTDYGAAEWSVKITNIDVDGKFQANTPFTPTAVEVRLGDENTADAEGTLLISQAWTSATSTSKQITASGSAYISKAQQNAIATGQVFVVIVGNNGDNLRNDPSHVLISNDGAPNHRGTY